MEDGEDDIAVIGIGCNFPGGEGLDNFWSVLLEGKNCVVDIPTERFDASLWSDADDSKPGTTQTSKAAFIEGFNEFDHRFFGITEVEADFLDPQQKLLLQCTYRALEDAGVAMERISGSRTGVYIGLMNKDYEMIRNNSPTTITHYNGTGTAMSMAANRISFTFNLTGPSFAVDCACSSSLVALHLACQAMRQGDCEMALCGGVSCIIEPRVFVALSKAKMISPDGTSKPFSSSADGYGRGEGCGIVLLRPLKKAIKDCNKIWGIISKTAVNQDGRSVTPITKPSMIQQQELLQRIYSQTDIANVQYIEAHGTGTPVGDPIEAGSISNIIAKAKPPGSETLRIGSVKSNIGHTESAAGVAGLIKVLLMMKNETIVPSVFYSEDSASIDVKALSLSIPIKAERWETNGSSERVAGINSFGFGGTNAHVIVREFRQNSVAKWVPKCGPNLFVISAASEASCILSIADTHQRLCGDQTTDLQALTYTSAFGRSHSRHKYRKAFLTSSLTDLKHQLSTAMKATFQPVRSDVQVVFVFCGNGIAYKGMCRQLLKEVPVFREKVREVENLFQRHKGIGISQWLAGECDQEDFSKPNVVQPLLFAIQVGIATLLKHWGVKPDVVLGHSLGEVAAAECSGLLSLEDAVKVLHLRSTLQSKVTGGKMLLVSNTAVEKVSGMVAEYSGKICVAAFNSPLSCTLSGDAESIDNLHERLRNESTERSIFLQELDVPAAYHSHMMDPILDDIEKNIDPLVANTMVSKLFSTVTSNSYSDSDFRTGRYWARNIREPVLFEQTLRAVAKDDQAKKKNVYVEIGPRRALQRNIHETLGDDTIVLSSVQPGKEYDTILSTVAKLFELGINVDWHELYRGCETLPTLLPVYQFVNTKKEFNFEDVRKCDESPASSPHALISQMKQGNNEYLCNLSLDTVPYLWEHKNNGVPIVPGAFYVELAYASITASLRPKKPAFSLQLKVRFESPFTLSSNFHQLKVSVEDGGNGASFKIQSTVATHASGTYRCTDGQPLLEEPTICLDMLYQRCKTVMNKGDIYSILLQAGFEYGSIFKQLDEVHIGDEFREAVTVLRVPCELLKDLHDYFIHPVLLDYFLQVTAVVAIRQLKVKCGFPSAIGSVAISGPLQEEMVLYLRATQETQDFLEVCGSFSNKEGYVLVELKGVRISFLSGSSSVLKSYFFHSEIIGIPEMKDLQNHQLKAIVFEDRFGIAKGLRPYLNPESTLVEMGEYIDVRNVVFHALNTDEGLEKVLFIWGVEDLSSLSSEKMLDHLVTCCELFRQIVLALKDNERYCTIHVITYRSSETIVDHVNPGFVLSGMTRACAAEMTGLSFHLIDLASVTSEDIQMLVDVIKSCKEQEVMISKGQASTTRIAGTPMRDEALQEGGIHSTYVSDFVLQTADPYRMAELTAVSYDPNVDSVPVKSVEVLLTSVCVHSSDYFPVTTSHLRFGKTMYWNRQTSHNHNLLSLDFTGIVTAVGKDVCSQRVGDQVASCYPIAATAKVIISEAVCYSVKRFPFLKETPCVSYFILAWEVLQRILSPVKQQHRKMIIVSSTPASALMKVLALTANRTGWNVSYLPHLRGQQLQFDRSHAFVFLPPFDRVSLQGMYDIGGHDRHIVFVCSDQMPSSLRENILALKSECIHVHKLDVLSVLQKANLQAQSWSISNWLMSLGFDSASLPLKKEPFQFSSTKEPQATGDTESYLTTKTVKQVVLHDKDSDCSVSDIPFITRSRPLFKQNSVYIVTGGLSGLGFETVRFIAHNGGGHIVTLSRRALTDEKHSEMELIERRFGVTIMNVQCDVSVTTQVLDALSKIEQRFPSCPVKGVFHSAAVLHDALIETLDESLFRKVLQPKVSGALNLHYATLHNKLDFFVCYSSISSFIGNPSQCNYAAANSFLDSFCHYRRNLGLAGQSINWGPMNLGLLLNKGHFQKFLEAKGMMVMDACHIPEALEKCLLMNRPQQVICKFNFRNLNLHVLSQNAALRGRLSALVETELKHDISNERKVEHFPSTHGYLRRIISDISNISLDELDDDSALCALGIDSMLAMTLQNKIFQDTGMNVPLIRILDPSCTLATLESIVINNG